MKFKYKDKVKIIGGFYKGRKGKIENYSHYNDKIQYLVTMSFWGIMIKWIDEKNLEIL